MRNIWEHKITLEEVLEALEDAYESSIDKAGYGDLKPLILADIILFIESDDNFNRMAGTLKYYEKTK